MALVRDEASRAHGLSALERRIEEVGERAEADALAAAMASVFVEIWDDAVPHRSRMLRLCLLLGHPGAVPVWSRALGIDGTALAQENTRLAFAREIAAMNLARSSRGDANVAERIAAAYSVRNADGRVTMVWLAAHVMQGERCPACAERLSEVLEQDADTRLPKEFQLSVLMARYSIAKLREPTSHMPGR